MTLGGDPNDLSAKDVGRIESTVDPKTFLIDTLTAQKVDAGNSWLGLKDTDMEDVLQRFDLGTKYLEEARDSDPKEFSPRAAALAVKAALGSVTGNRPEGITWGDWQWGDGSVNSPTTSKAIEAKIKKDYVAFKKALAEGTAGRTGTGEYATRLQKATQDYDEVKAAYGIVPKYNAAEVAQSYMRLPPVR
jgi:hypothetical protein